MRNFQIMVALKKGKNKSNKEQGQRREKKKFPPWREKPNLQTEKAHHYRKKHMYI